MDRLSPTAQKPPETNALDSTKRKVRPTVTQLSWLSRGLEQAGGKLPLFDHFGQRYDSRTIQSCIAQGWAEPWFKNPIKPDWLVCRLTAEGRALAEAGEALAEEGSEDADGHQQREARIRDLVDDIFR
ncbi:hypothetical protein [Pelagibius sp. 7325]|uniref:hypothetical protein n=1 Tax=Pelagibius sp. 7325 TaxID=3131994 RepID=UPI0030EEB850